MPEVSTKASYPPGDPRLIMQWARRYAKSRTISFLVQWVFIVVMVLVIGVASSLTSIAYEQNQWGLLTVSLTLMGGAMAVLAWFSVSPWGSEIIWRVTNWLYGREGYASYTGGEKGERPTPLWMTLLGGGLVMYHLLLAMLISLRVIDAELMQPASALYMTPFLAIMIRHQDLGFWAWIWPGLYGLHAVLLLTGTDVVGLALAGAGWEMLSRSKKQLLNMVFPVFGYGLVAIIVGHAYSRYALYNLKRLARTGLPASDDSNGGGDAG